jgi:hypothetical protein
MPSRGFETTIPAIQQPYTYALYRKAIGVCSQLFTGPQKLMYVGCAAYDLCNYYFFTYVIQHDLPLLFNSAVPRLICSAQAAYCPAKKLPKFHTLQA